MTKKEFMLQVIEFLPDWKMGWGLKALIENDQLSPDVFEKLYEVFKDTVNQTYTDIQKKKFSQNLEKVKSMKAKESKVKQDDLVDLDSMFQNL